MKKRMQLLLISIFLGLSIYAQNTAGLANAFKKGNTQELATYLGDKVEYIVQGESKNLDKSKTQQALTEFFSANKVTSFTVNHEGNRGESGFIVGTLVTSGGNYRVNCYFKKTDEQFLIHQIRIDKSNE